MNRVIALAGIVVLVGCTANSSPPSATAPPASTSTSTSTSTPASTPDATPSASPSYPGDSNIEVSVPRPGSMVAAFGSLWVQSGAERSIWRIRPDGHVLARIPRASRPKGPGPFGSIPGGLDAGFGSVWSLTNDALVRIDPASNRVVARLPITLPSAMDVGEGAVWVVCCRSEVKLLKIDPVTMRADVFANLGTSLAAMGVGDGYVWWVRFSEGGGMDRVDPRTGEILELQVGYNDQFVVPTPRWIWLISSGWVQRIDANGSLRDAKLTHKADRSIGASYVNGTLWINDGGAVGIDATSGAITARIPAFTVKEGTPGGIAQLGNRLWVADPEDDKVFGLALG